MLCQQLQTAPNKIDLGPIGGRNVETLSDFLGIDGIDLGLDELIYCFQGIFYIFDEKIQLVLARSP